MAIRRLEDEKLVLRKRVHDLERDDHPASETRHLREENATLRAKLATVAKEKTEVTRERDVLLRRLNGVKQLLDDPAVRRVYLSVLLSSSRWTQLDDNVTSHDEPGPSTALATSSTVVSARDPRAPTSQRAVSGPADGFSSPRTDLSEPVTDVTVMLDTSGRAIRSRPRTAPTRVGNGSQPHSSATLMRLRAQEAPAVLNGPFVDARTPTSPPTSPPFVSAATSPLSMSALHMHAPNSDTNESSMRRPISVAHAFALNTSPGMMSEGLSVQYEESPGPGLSAAGPGRAVQKWRLHFAKPPSTAMAMAITPMATDMLVEKLELDEKAVRFLFFLCTACLSFLQVLSGYTSTTHSV